MSNEVLAAIILVVRRLDNDTIAAARRALNDGGKISKQNPAFEALKERGLIDESGDALDDELLEALAFEIDTRVAAGTFK
ncbi:MAG: hypothetical protein V3R81_06570 [Gammaproteobacteria bacterium]